MSLLLLMMEGNQKSDDTDHDRAVTERIGHSCLARDFFEVLFGVLPLDVSIGVLRVSASSRRGPSSMSLRRIIVYGASRIQGAAAALAPVYSL